MVKSKNNHVSVESRKASKDAGLKPDNPEPLSLKYSDPK